MYLLQYTPKTVSFSPLRSSPTNPSASPLSKILPKKPALINSASTSNLSPTRVFPKKAVAKSPSPERKIINYSKIKEKETVRYRLNFDSPLTSEAASRIGVTFEDCIKKQKTEFFVPGVSEKIAALRYTQHINRVNDTIEQLISARAELIKRQQRKERSKADLLNLINKFGNQPTFMKNQKLAPIQKRQIRDFIQASWQDLNEPLKTSPKKPLLELSTAREKKPKKDRTPARSQSCSRESSFQRISDIIHTQLKEELKAKIEKRDLMEQRMKVMKRIKKRQEDEEAAQADQAQQMLRLCLQKQRNAGMRSEREKVTKILYATRASRNVTEVKEKAELCYESARQHYEAKCARKAQKIADYKEAKTTRLNQTTESIKAEEEKKKAKHEQLLALCQQKQSEYIEKLEEYIKAKYTTAQNSKMSERSNESQYNKELNKLNQTKQEENRMRLAKIQEYKRNLILAMHEEIRSRNELKEKTFQTYQCDLRANTIKERLKHEKMYDKLLEIVKRSKEKASVQKVETMFKGMDGKLGLGISLKKNLWQRGPAPKSEEAESDY